MREVALIDNDQLVNIVVIADGKAGDKKLGELATTYQAAVEVTGVDPMPGLGLGWTWDGEQLVQPVNEPDPEHVALMDADNGA